MLKHFLNPPNWFTSAGMFCGLYAIILATGVGVEQDFYKSALMIFFAGIFDMLDGRVARITKTGSEFGVQLDSLADVVSFGMAPAVLLYAWGVRDFGMWGLVGAFAFMLCGAFRLARFNITCGDGKAHAWSEGLTITTAGGTVATWVMAHAASGRTFVALPESVMVITLILSYLMVSRVPYRTFKVRKSKRAAIIGVALFLSAILVLSVRYNLSTAFVSLAGLYCISGPAELIFRRTRGRFSKGGA